MSRAPGKPTCSGVTSRHSKTRISRRLRLRSRVRARVWVVGRGGKFPRRQKCRQGLNQFLLVLLDRQRVIAPALEENLLGRFDLSVKRVGQRRPVDQWHFGQHLPGGGRRWPTRYWSTGR